MRNNYFIIVGLSLVTAILLVLVVMGNMSSPTPYSVFNTGPNGDSRLYSIASGVIYNYAELGKYEASESVIITAAVKRWDLYEAKTFRGFLNNGGIAIIYGKPKILLSDLRLLGLNISIANETVLDPVRNAGSRFYPMIMIINYNLTIYMYAPHPIKAGNLCIDGYTSNYSYLDTNGNEHYDIGEPVHSFPVLLHVKVGKGTLYVAATDELFTNSLFAYNQGLIKSIAKNRVILVDQVCINQSIIDYIRGYKNTVGPGGTVNAIIILLTGVTTYFITRYVKI